MTSGPERHFVTGGAGFIGSHLVERLLGQGHIVVAYDNFGTGRRSHLEPYLDHPGFRLVEGDILTLPHLAEAMAGADVVWHLAANTDILKGNAQVDLDLENCTIGTHRALEAMRATGVRRIIFASSAAVYGDIDRLPTTEAVGPLLPISLYGAAKVAGETLISAYCHLFGFQAWMFRFGNVIGARMGHGVIYDFIQKLRRNPRELEVLGDGEQEKPYLLVEDCLGGMECAFRRSGAWCDVYNLGPEDGIKVKRIADIVMSEMDLDRDQVCVRYTGGQRGWPGDAPRMGFDASKMRALGWRAEHTSAEAVRIATRRLLRREDRDPEAAGRRGSLAP